MMRHYINPDNKSYIATYCYKQINTWFAEYWYYDNGWVQNREVNNLHFPNEETLIKFMGDSYKEIIGLEELNDYRRSFRMMDELIA